MLTRLEGMKSRGLSDLEDIISQIDTSIFWLSSLNTVDAWVQISV